MTAEMAENTEKSGVAQTSPDIILSRHSLKPKGEDVATERYPGIAGVKGLERAGEKAGEILDILEKAPARTVLFIGGASEQVRTKTTAELFGDEIQTKLRVAGRDDIVVLTREEITNWHLEKGEKAERNISSTVKRVVDFLKANGDKKVVIDLPLMLGAFREKRWLTPDGKADHEFVLELAAKHNDDLSEALGDWLENGTGGKYPELEPEQVVKEEMADLEKLRSFAKEQVPDRPVMVGIVSHGFNTDALVAYIAGNGRINVKEYIDSLPDKSRFKEAEIAQINLNPMSVTFRGKTLRAA